MGGDGAAARAWPLLRHLRSAMNHGQLDAQAATAPVTISEPLVAVTGYDGAPRDSVVPHRTKTLLENVRDPLQDYASVATSGIQVPVLESNVTHAFEEDGDARRQWRAL